MQNLDPVFDSAAKSAPNPFLDDVFAPGITDLPGVADIHGNVLTHCVKAFETLLRETAQPGAPWGSAGRTILIAAPRAGFGKSHLVGRIRSVTESLVTAVSLPFDPVRAVSWETFLESLLNQYRSARCPQNLGCTLFDETARFFQSNCVRLALEHGAFDEKEIPETEVAMRVQFRDVFDPKAGTRLTSWYAKRSPEIIDAASRALCKRWNLTFDELAFWNRFFLDHARPKADPFLQLKDLADAGARQRLTEFLRIASDCRPVAFVADHLDGFFGSDSAGMDIARILTTLRDEIPRSITLLCLNEDLWQSVFEERIPTAWIDRLTADAIPLKGISTDSAEALLQARLQAAGITGPGATGFIRCFRESQGWDTETSDSPIYPREIFRAAAQLWDRAPGETASPAFTGKTAPEFPPREEVRTPVSTPASPRSIPPQEFRSDPPAPSVSDTAAAARAAGKDLTNIESIIADIRGTGARTVSESSRGSSGFRHSDRINGTRPSAKSDLSSSANSRDPNPFWAKNLEKRLQEMESESLAAHQEVEWDPIRLAYLIRSVGDRFPAVGQTEQQVAGPGGGRCLRWNVKKHEVILGFEPPSNLLYWKALLQLSATTSTPVSTKIAVLSHHSEPFDFHALSGIGTDATTALHFFDVIKIGESDLRRLFAAENFLREAEAASQADAAVRVIARRLDTFWRRLTRPITSIEPAG